MGALRAILENGLRVPEDIALIGCGNVHYDPLLRVPLSSIDQDSSGIGQRVAGMALGVLEAKGAPARPRTVLLTPRLVARESTRRAAAVQRSAAHA